MKNLSATLIDPCRDFILFFFFNDTATTEIYTLSLHDALPISVLVLRQRDHPAHGLRGRPVRRGHLPATGVADRADRDRKSTRLNSSHSQISYAVFCLKKKKTRADLTDWY